MLYALSSFIFKKIRRIFIEEEDNPSEKVNLVERKLDDFDIDDTEDLEALQTRVIRFLGQTIVVKMYIKIPWFFAVSGLFFITLPESVPNSKFSMK